jgi:hypothetical protein
VTSTHPSRSDIIGPPSNRRFFQHERILLQVFNLLLHRLLQIFEGQKINVVDRFGNGGIARLSVFDNFAQLARVETNHPAICMTNNSYLLRSQEPLRNDDGT